MNGVDTGCLVSLADGIPLAGRTGCNGRLRIKLDTILLYFHFLRLFEYCNLFWHPFFQLLSSSWLRCIDQTTFKRLSLPLLTFKTPEFHRLLFMVTLSLMMIDGGVAN